MPVPTMMDFDAACARISQLEEMMQSLQKFVALQGNRTSASHLDAPSPRNSLGFRLGQSITGGSSSKDGISRIGSPASYEDRKVAPPLRNFEEAGGPSKSGERDHEDMAMMLEVRIRQSPSF